MLRTYRFVILLFLLLCIGNRAYSQDNRTEIRVDFRVNSASIDRGYSQNTVRLSEITSFLQRIEQDSTLSIVGVSFCGSASPEGSYQLNQKASEILKEITGGKYDMLLVDEKLKMSLYTGERKVPLEQLSRGTVEQIYFALRMAASDILYEEEYPLIFDDTFVFYDDVRLENTLRWLKRTKKQVIIFTCQKREEEILKKLGLE